MRVRMTVNPALERGMKEAPQIVDEHLRPAHAEAGKMVQGSIRHRITELRLVKRRRMYNSVRYRVSGKAKSLRATVAVSRASLLEFGGTIRPKRGEVMRFAIRQYAQIETIGGRQLKRTRYEAVEEQWVTKREFTIKPRRFVYAGTERAKPGVRTVLADAGVAAVRKIFAEGVK